MVGRVIGGVYIGQKETTITLLVGNDHYGQKLGAEKRYGDMHYPSLAIFQITMSKRKNDRQREKNNVSHMDMLGMIGERVGGKRETLETGNVHW